MGTEIGPFSAAAQMLAALDSGEISAAELVELHIDRIEVRDGDLNAIAVHTFDKARAAAVAADAARASGARAPLLGLPMTLKGTVASVDRGTRLNGAGSELPFQISPASSSNAAAMVSPSRAWTPSS